MFSRLFLLNRFYFSCSIEDSTRSQFHHLKLNSVRLKSSAPPAGAAALINFFKSKQTDESKQAETQVPLSVDPPQPEDPEHRQRKILSRLYSPQWLVTACQSQSTFVLMQAARSLAYISKDRDSAIKMGQSGSFEAIWLLSHSKAVSGSDGGALVMSLVETLLNLVAIPRNASKLKSSLPLLHLIRIWGSLAGDYPDICPKLLSLLMILSRTSELQYHHDSSHPNEVSSEFGAITEEINQVHAVLRSGGDRFAAQKLLLDALLPLHTASLLNKKIPPAVLNQNFSLAIDVLIGFAQELKRIPPEEINPKYLSRLISDAFTIFRDIVHRDFKDTIHMQTQRLMAQALSYFAQYDQGRAELVRQGSNWLPILSSWASSPDPAVRLHTAHALAHLLENDIIGTYVIQELGFGLIASLTDIIDLDVQNTVARMFGRLRSKNAVEFDASVSFVKDYTIDHEWKVIPSNIVTINK